MAKYAARSLAALRQDHRGLRDIPRPEYIPFKSDILNLLIGGVQFNAITEMSGDPNLFKSTLAAEVVGEALTMGAVVAVHDKERKLNNDRFESLSINAHSNPNFLYYQDNLPEYRMTIEQYFRDMQELWLSVRDEDVQRVAARFESDTATDEEFEHYRGILPQADQKGQRTARRCAEIAKRLTMPSLLRRQDKTPILSIVDSATSMPADEEAIKEVQEKNGVKYEIPNANPATNARAWSQEMKAMMWLDERTAVVQIAQKRLKLNFHGPSYQKAAVSSAQEFYNATRLSIYRASGGQIYQSPTGSGLVIGNSGPAGSRTNQVGQIIMVSISKGLSGMSTEVPLFMLGYSGTDRINSIWEFLTQRDLLKHASMGLYQFSHEIFINVFGDMKIKRANFVEFYMANYAQLGACLIDYKHFMMTGAVPTKIVPAEESAAEAGTPPPPPLIGSLALMGCRSRPLRRRCARRHSNARRRRPERRKSNDHDEDTSS